MLVFVLVCITLYPFYFLQLSSRGRESWLLCFYLIVFWMFCYCKCLVAFLHGALGWSAVYDCGIA